MENAINTQLRDRAFIKFIIFFLVTTAIIVIAIYFNFRIPSENSEILREKIISNESQLYHQQQFTNTMVTARNLMDSLNRSGQSNPFLERDIANQIDSLKRPEYVDSSIYAAMNQEIINTLYSYYHLTKNSISSRGVQQQVEKLTNDLSKCEAKHNDSESSMPVYKTNSNFGY